MKKRTSVFLNLTILFSLVLLNLSVFAKTQSNSIIEKDGSILLPSQKTTANVASNFTLAPLRTPEWRAFFDANGKWTVLVDKVTLTPHRAFGKPVQIRNFNNITDENVQAASIQFLRDNSNILNLNPDELILTKTKKVNKLWYVGYKQAYKGIEVLLSEVELRIRDDGKVIAFGVDYYNNINVNTKPTIPYTDAMDKSYIGLDEKTKIESVQSEGKVFILPVKFNGKVDFKLVYDVKVETSEPIGKYTSFVDAHSGNVVWRLNHIREANTTVNTKGMVKEKYSYDPSLIKPFPGSYFKIASQQKVTDTNGFWTNDLTSQSAITAKMEGTWAKVKYKIAQNQQSKDSAYFQGTINPGDNFNLEWNDNNSQKYERMLFYHTNYIHDYLKKLDPSFNGMDFQVIVTILTYGSSPNASSDGSNINFYSTDLPTHKFAETPSILYHEYTHSVNAQLYLLYGGSGQLGMINRTCNEATADLGSSFIIDDEMIGRGAFASDNNKNIRILENNNIYPDSIEGEEHHDGMILSGAFWDFKKATSREVAEQISHYSKYGTPDDEDDGIAFNEWFLEALLTDDNLGTGDNDLSNGTPHLFELVTAFNEHQIGTDLLLAMSYEHTPLPDTKNITDPYVVEFDLKSTRNILDSHPDSIIIVYSTDNFKNFTVVPAVKVPQNEDPDSTKYRAEIPAMPNGTMIKYYIQAKESVSGRTFKFTGTFPDFKPYQFLVGYETLYIEDFEEEPSWTIGEEGDDAAKGLWEWAIPKKETLNFGNGDYVLQPGEDHSPNGTKCFVTGSLVSVTGTIRNLNDCINSMQFMPDGTTTLTSRIYDLSKVEKPALRYYNYFSSEFWILNAPGAESTLIFEMSSNGGSSWTNIDTINKSTWGWTKSQVTIEDYLQKTNRMRFRFVVNSQEIQAGLLVCLTEALVDDFEILYPSNVAPPTVIADFAGTPTTGVAPLSVQFRDSSKGNVASWWWDFGDAANSSEKNPVHQYTSTGIYTVSLTISDGTNQDTKTKNDYIYVSALSAEFSANPLEGIKPLEVQFTDKSKGTVSSWFWDFGDGDVSTEQNPIHTFVDEGSYSVILLVKHLNDSSEVIKDDLITVYDAFGASFSADKTSGLIPLTVNFTDQSFGNPISWSWDFGDGGTSAEQNPMHVYTTQGIYYVTLTVSDGEQNSTKTKTDFISAYRPTAVDDNSDGLIGLQVYPNPFSSSTAIYYELLSPAHVSLKIYDLMGNLVSSLVDESQSDGRKIAVWNGNKSDGSRANAGLYIYRLRAGSKQLTGKLILY